MNLLLDTHVLLWAAGMPERLSPQGRRLLEDGGHTLVFSVASLWEVAIKRGLGREDFQVDPRRLRGGLLVHGYRELPIRSEHALATQTLPPLHRDPFDRMLVAQAQVEGLTLVTADVMVARYPGAIRHLA